MPVTVDNEGHGVDPKCITNMNIYYASENMGQAVKNRQDDIIYQKNQDNADTQNELKVAIENEEEITLTTTAADNMNSIIYRKSSNHIIHQGRVVSELCTRILSRNIAQSTILVVTPDIPAQYFPGNETAVNYDRQDQQLEVDRGDNNGHMRGQLVVSRAIKEVHTNQSRSQLDPTCILYTG